MIEIWRSACSTPFRSTVACTPITAIQRAAALAGHGVIWQPTFLIGDDLRTGKLVRVLREYRLLDIDVLALYPSRRHVSAKVRAAIDFLVNAFSGLPPWDNA